MAAVKWVDWLMTQEYGKFFVRIDDEYLNDTYNYYGLVQKTPNFKISSDLILGNKLSPSEYPSTWPADIDDYGLCLYGLLHARYLLTKQGQDLMYQKVLSFSFPSCPRTLCEHHQCLPYGTSDIIGQSQMKLFCPSCREVYYTDTLSDGAFYGPSYIHPFLNRYPDLSPPAPPPTYTPRIFGFRICPESELTL